MQQVIRSDFSHAGIKVWDLPRMRDFYQSALGLVVSDSGIGPASGQDFVFLTGDPTKHHQFVLVAGRPQGPNSLAVFQLSFRLKSLHELRTITEQARKAGGSAFHPMNHGNAWSVYFSDPEGNTIEVYVDTPWYVPQPFGDPLDLSQSDEEIFRATEARCRACEGFKPVEQWRNQMANRLAKTISETKR